MGYVTNSKSIRNQIEKDLWLLETGLLEQVMWLLIKGGSEAVKRNLSDHGIGFREGWPIA